ncbi:HD domain-containing protein [Cohnella kolymensis]|uniref:HD domain-containing protein n=1 Tax=Cohnella kolymensis TaxID=1590652 RepID=UPI0009E4EB80|nr:HD domain-containing protein [Cohnella kolymensis]
MSLIDRAIEFSAYAHREQTRNGTEIPYISHPFAVGLILQQAGCTEDVIAAGILHDTLEDTTVTAHQLLAEFGPVVLEIVEGCSEPDKDAAWEDRKQHTLHFLKEAPLSVRLVACADKLHNIRSVNRDLAKYSEYAWTRFKRGRASQQWYFTGLVESLGYASRFPLLDELEDEVEEVFGPPLEFPEWKALRKNQKFIDLAFETAYGDKAKIEEREPKFRHFGASELIKRIHERADPLHPEYNEDFDELAEYLQRRGIEFQSNSEGPEILIGFSTALKRLLNLYPHEVYHHFKRNLKRGIL